MSKNVGRLQIAVHDPALVRRLHGLGQCRRQRGGLAGRLRRARQLLAKAASLDELHGEIWPSLMIAHVVDLDDIRMPQARRPPWLRAETALIRAEPRTRRQAAS